jgi:hypothetical protein
MATNFSVRIEKNAQDFITAWIDRDGSICIEQPFNPEKNGATWESEEEALVWANAHVEMLNNQESQIDRIVLLEQKVDQILEALNK